jgi:hypothetical protein
LQDVLANLDDLASLLHEGAALAVELGGPAPAIEERRAELLLQVPDLEADGRLGQPDRVRRRGKASIVVGWRSSMSRPATADARCWFQFDPKLEYS